MRRPVTKTDGAPTEPGAEHLQVCFLVRFKETVLCCKPAICQALGSRCKHSRQVPARKELAARTRQRLRRNVQVRPRKNTVPLAC